MLVAIWAIGGGRRGLRRWVCGRAVGVSIGDGVSNGFWNVHVLLEVLRRGASTGEGGAPLL